MFKRKGRLVGILLDILDTMYCVEEMEVRRGSENRRFSTLEVPDAGAPIIGGGLWT